MDGAYSCLFPRVDERGQSHNIIAKRAREDDAPMIKKMVRKGLMWVSEV